MLQLTNLSKYYAFCVPTAFLFTSSIQKTLRNWIQQTDLLISLFHQLNYSNSMCFSFWLIKSDIQNKQLQHLEKKTLPLCCKYLTKGWISNKNNSTLINLPKIFDSQSWNNIAQIAMKQIPTIGHRMQSHDKIGICILLVFSSVMD